MIATISQMQRLDLAGWLYGLTSAVVGGGASAVTAGISIQLLDPVNDFHGWMLFKLMLTTFAINGALALFFYLKSSPLPPLVQVETTTTSTAYTGTGDGRTVEKVEQKVTETKPADEKP